jgi:hypothetical protein
VPNYRDAVNPEQHARGEITGSRAGDNRPGRFGVAVGECHLMRRPSHRPFYPLEQDIAGETVGDDDLRSRTSGYVMPFYRTRIAHSESG